MPFRILVVDDDDDVRDVLARYLRRRGYVVEDAADGGDAVEAVRTHEPDLMLLDICLPTMSGLDVLEELRGDNLHMRTIAISGIPDDHMVRSSRELGAIAFVAKPFDFSALTAQIDTTLREAVGS